MAAPAEKLIIAGTRPADITAKVATAAPLAFGSMTPMAAAFLRQRHQFAAEDRRAEQQFAIGEGAGDRVFERDAAHAVLVGGFDQRWRSTVRSVDVVRNTRSDMT